jgi:hypothetical protein
LEELFNDIEKTAIYVGSSDEDNVSRQDGSSSSSMDSLGDFIVNSSNDEVEDDVEDRMITRRAEQTEKLGDERHPEEVKK